MLTASFLGYEKYQKNISVSASKTTKLNFSLTATDSRLNEVVITGTMKEVSRSESAIAVEIFSPKTVSKKSGE